MALSFSANQYENAFFPKKLDNWEVPKVHREYTWYSIQDMISGQRPSRHDGFTQIIGNERGHILPGIPRSAKNPWGDFVGTWDLPKRIPGNCANVKTARTYNGQDHLRRQYESADKVLSGTLKNQTRLSKTGALPSLRPLAIPASGRRSGAHAPGSKMLQDGSPPAKSGSPLAKLTSPKALSPKPLSPAPLTSRSPIPGIMDVPWDGRRSASPPVLSPGVKRVEDGVIAF